MLDRRDLADAEHWLRAGIIDGHTHYDAQITWDPFVDPSPALGVTTAILGNCGFTIAPCKPQDRDLTMRHLTHVEGMSLDALRAGIRWGFESFPHPFLAIEQVAERLELRAVRRHESKAQQATRVGNGRGAVLRGAVLHPDITLIAALLHGSHEIRPVNRAGTGLPTSIGVGYLDVSDATGTTEDVPRGEPFPFWQQLFTGST